MRQSLSRNLPHRLKSIPTGFGDLQLSSAVLVFAERGLVSHNIANG